MCRMRSIPLTTFQPWLESTEEPSIVGVGRTRAAGCRAGGVWIFLTWGLTPRRALGENLSSRCDQDVGRAGQWRIEMAD